MMINEYVSKAMQDAAQLAGERNRRLLAARRGRMALCQSVVRGAPVRRLARLVLRRAPA